MTAKRLGRGALLWVFGLAVTIFLLSLWGRSIVADTSSLSESVAPIAASATVVDTFTGWLAGELVDAGLQREAVESAVREVMGDPQVVAALDRIVVEVVLAAGASGTGPAVVDVASHLGPAMPAISGSVSQSTGGQISAEQVALVLGSLDPIVVRPDGSRPVIGSGSPIAFRLGTASLLAFLVMAVSGWGAVATSDDRLLALKSLLTRVSLGAMSFAVMLRLGSWVLSPTGGRAPVSSAFSTLLRSQWLVPLTVGVVAGAGVGAAWLVRRNRSVRGGPAVGLEAEPVESAEEDRGRRQEPGMAPVVVEPALVGNAAED